MNKNTKRYLISTAETFAAAFVSTFIMMLDTAIQSGNVDKAVFFSIFMGSIVAGTKVVSKRLREFITKDI